jgi:ornithine cyclodeaminase/alanine dehydrogenase-like protein (mu-crystallin family)
MALRIINAELTRELLPMQDCIRVLQQAMIAASNGSIAIPPRLVNSLTDDSALFFLMPASSLELGVYGAKLIGLHPRNPAKHRPLIQGFVSLFDHETGEPIAIVEGAIISAIRTAAASGLATQILAREDVTSCGIFGAGVQAVAHIDAMCAVRPIKEFVIWGRDFDRTQRFAAEQAKRTGLNIYASENPGPAAACDLICTVTASPVPVLQGEWVSQGAHINLVGAHTLTTREADTELLVNSKVYIDLWESARNEGGDVMIPIAEGAIEEDHIRGEIGQLLSGNIDGRKDDKEITLYNSLGITAQDLFAAEYVYQKALSKGLGVCVEF